MSSKQTNKTYIEATETNRTVSKQTETNRNNPKCSEKYQNMLSIKLFWLVCCLFWFNRNDKTLCFGIEAKRETTETKSFETNQNKLNQTETTLNVLKKIPK
jgi:hypothetical protein